MKMWYTYTADLLFSSKEKCNEICRKIDGSRKVTVSEVTQIKKYNWVFGGSHPSRLDAVPRNCGLLNIISSLWHEIPPQDQVRESPEAPRALLVAHWNKKIRFYYR